MAKDPAFLFYTNDFISGTQFFTNEEVGLYIRLLCAQHQHGRLNEKQVKIICNSLDIDVLNKFSIDEQGLYFNERLESEIEKRSKFSLSRSANRLGKTKDLNKPPKNKNTRKTYVNHMEDENENKDKIEVIIKTDFEKTFDSYLEMRKVIKKPATENAIGLIKKELEKLAPNNQAKQIDILNQSIMRNYTGVFPLKQNEDNKQETSLAHSKEF